MSVLVDGVVWYQLSFDEIYDMEAACISKWLSEMNVPFLKLETAEASGMTYSFAAIVR